MLEAIASRLEAATVGRLEIMVSWSEFGSAVWSSDFVVTWSRNRRGHHYFVPGTVDSQQVSRSQLKALQRVEPFQRSTAGGSDSLDWCRCLVTQLNGVHSTESTTSPVALTTRELLVV